MHSRNLDLALIKKHTIQDDEAVDLSGCPRGNLGRALVLFSHSDETGSVAMDGDSRSNVGECGQTYILMCKPRFKILIHHVPNSLLCRVLLVQVGMVPANHYGIPWGFTYKDLAQRISGDKQLLLQEQTPDLATH